MRPQLSLPRRCPPLPPKPHPDSMRDPNDRNAERQCKEVSAPLGGQEDAGKGEEDRQAKANDISGGDTASCGSQATTEPTAAEIQVELSSTSKQPPPLPPAKGLQPGMYEKGQRCRGTLGG